MKKHQGISLIEITISLFLTTLMMSSLSQLYIHFKRYYVKENKTLEQRADLIWASDLLRNSIMQAGFTPCLSVDELEVIDRRNVRDPIKGLKITGQDSLTIGRMSEYFIEMENEFKGESISVPATLFTNIPHALLITDCEHGEIVPIARAKRQEGDYLLTLASPLLFPYSKVTYLGEWIEEKWFIKKNPQGTPALYYQSTHAEEITSLVHGLELKQWKIKHHSMLRVTMHLDEEKNNN